MVRDRLPALSEDPGLAKIVSTVLHFNSNKMQSFTSSISSLDSLKKINGFCMCMPKRCVFFDTCLSSLQNITSARSERLKHYSYHGICCNNTLIIERNLTEPQLNIEAKSGSWRTGKIKQTPEFPQRWDKPLIWNTPLQLKCDWYARTYWCKDNLRFSQNPDMGQIQCYLQPMRTFPMTS